MNEPLFDYTVALADDALVSAQRMGWWISRAPELEEDVALANIGLDQLGQARHLLTYAGELEGRGGPRTIWPTSATNGSTATSSWSSGRWRTSVSRWPGCWCSRRTSCTCYRALAVSGDVSLSGVAGKAVKEVTYHVDHASRWVLRLGDGTDESHARVQAALDAEWPFVGELFTPCDPSLAGAVADPAALREPVLTDVRRVVTEATLTVPEVTPARGGGRVGLHTEHLGYLLAEMQHLHRSHPGATW